jgi:outer membrane protein TolC
VLDIERSLFDAELLASAALQQRYASLVKLYKALGGGWYEE